MESIQELPVELWELVASWLSYRDAIPLLKASKLHKRAVEAACTRFDDREEILLPLSQLRFAFLSMSQENILENIILRLTRISELQLVKGMDLSTVVYQKRQILRNLTRLECIASSRDPVFSKDLPLATPNLAHLRLNVSDLYFSRVPCLTSLRTLHLDDMTHLTVTHFRRVFMELCSLEELSISSISSSDFDIGPLIKLLPPSLERLVAITPNDHHAIDFSHFQRSLRSLKLDCAWFNLSNADHASSLTSLELSGASQSFGFLETFSTQLENLKYNFEAIVDAPHRSLAFCSDWRRWPNIRSLDFSNSRLRNVEYAELQRLSMLTKLCITNCRGVDGNGILATPRTLKEFHAAGIGYVGNNVWGGVFAHTGLYPSQIETLSIHSDSSDVFLFRILPRTLRSLDINRYALIGSGFSLLPTTLTRLIVSPSSLRSGEIDLLGYTCKRLRVLEIAVPQDVWTDYTGSGEFGSGSTAGLEALRKHVARQLKDVEYVQIAPTRM